MDGSAQLAQETDDAATETSAIVAIGRRLVPLVWITVLVAALWFLNRELRAFHFHQVLDYLRSLAPWKIGLSILLTVLNYLVLTLYDRLALKYVRVGLPYRLSAIASFIGYAFSIALGHAVLTGGAVRYRLYSSWGLSAESITKIIGFCGMAFWMGYLTLGGFVFLVHPVRVPEIRFDVRYLGAAFLIVVLSWLLLNVRASKPLVIRRWTIEAPGWRMVVEQSMISIVDLLLACSVLWVLLPDGHGISFFRLLSSFLLAVVAGVVSSVPGGLGVFDGMLVLLLGPDIPPPVALGTLVAYRAIYYLLPLATATLALLGTEVHRQRAAISSRLWGLEVWLPGIVPRALAGMTFFAGAVVLLTSAMPSVGNRMAWLAGIIPLEAIETSHVVASGVGAALLVVANGLWQRRDAAYGIAVALLAGGVVAVLLRGADYEEATVLAITLIALVPCHRYFRRRSVLTRGPAGPGWIVAVALVLIGTIWLGAFAFREVPYSPDLWTRYGWGADAPRFLRGVGVALVVFFTAGLTRLLQPAPRVAGEVPDPSALDRARAVIAHSDESVANLALLGDKLLLFAPPETKGRHDDGFIMFAQREASWIAMGGPIGPADTRETLAWEFRLAASNAGARPVFYEIGERELPLILDLGLVPYKLGEEAIVPLAGFNLEGGSRKGFRKIVRRVEEAGCRFEVVPASAVPALLVELRRVSESWLGARTTPEKGFSLGTFSEDYIRNFPVALVRRESEAAEGEIIAFANLWANDRLIGSDASSAAARHELSVDLMRFDRERSPDAVMEYLFVSLMLWGAAEGYETFSLGMAPLSGLEPKEGRGPAPLWHRFGALLYRHGEHFYNFQGLRNYKNKFAPAWRARYLAVPPGPVALAATLVDVTALISGGLSNIARRKA